MSAMNRPSRMVEVGAHIDRERTGATGKNVMLQQVLDLDRQ